MLLLDSSQTNANNDEEGNESTNKSAASTLVLEVYDSNFDFVREITLAFNEENEEAVTHSFKMHKRTNFATNGQVVYMQNYKLNHTYYFDLKTGLQ